MVRHKCRWLLVRLETEDQIRAIDEDSRSSSLGLETKHIYHAIRHVIEAAFGVAGSALLTEEFQGVCLLACVCVSCYSTVHKIQIHVVSININAFL